MMAGVKTAVKVMSKNWRVGQHIQPDLALC